MKYALILTIILLFAITSNAQETHFHFKEQQDFKRAQYHIDKEEYALAYPLVRKLRKEVDDNKVARNSRIADEILFYDILCGLKLQHDAAAAEAEQLMNAPFSGGNLRSLNFHLAHYFFTKGEFEKSVAYYEKSDLVNLSNDQIATAKFEQGYAYLNLRDFAKAKVLFNEIHQVKDSRYYLAANYYFGFLAFHDKEYEPSLNAFRVVEKVVDYAGVVPYYISQIYYLQGRYDEAIAYIENALSSGSSLYYNKEMKLLLGQLYFNREQYAKALPLLRDYVNTSDKVSREVLYELSYSYYQAKEFNQAIEGFKQLSNDRDSLGQNSMYILGDLYLQTGQKANARNAFQFSAYNNSNLKQQEISRFNYGKLSYELGYNDIALKELNTFLKDYPSSTYGKEARELLVNLLINSNNYAEALRLYDDISNPSPPLRAIYPRLLLGRAIDLMNAQQQNEALEYLNMALANNPDNVVSANANFWKGEIAFRQRRYDDAIRFYTSYLSFNPAAVGEASLRNAHYNLGYSYLHKENYGAAVANFEKVVTTVSANSSLIEQDSYARTADAFFMQRGFARASAMYDNLVRMGGAQAEYALYQKAMIAGISNGNDKINLLRSLISKSANERIRQDATAEIAAAYMADQKFSEAIPYLKTMVTTSDEGLKPKAYLRLALAQYNANQNKESLSTIEELLKKYPNTTESGDAVSIVRDIYVEEGRPGEYLTFMANNGKQVSALEADSVSYSAAEKRYIQGDCKGAITSLAAYTSQFPAGRFVNDANFYLADCFAKQKDYENALGKYLLVNKAGLGPNYESATLEAARIYYIQKKDYSRSKDLFDDLRKNASSPEMQLEARRGLVRSYYQLKDYSNAGAVAKELSTEKNISSDDKAIALLVLGKTQQASANFKEAIQSFRAVASLNKAAWGAEALYEIANSYYQTNDLTAAEKAGMEVIKSAGPYDYWITRSYILLGDVFLKQKDYFNAKATYESVANNASSPELRTIAKDKLLAAIALEKTASKLN